MKLLNIISKYVAKICFQCFFIFFIKKNGTPPSASCLRELTHMGLFGYQETPWKVCMNFICGGGRSMIAHEMKDGEKLVRFY